MSDQLSLFGEAVGPANAGAAEALSRAHAEAAAIAQELPSGIFFGTSSWSFPGWAGIVYSARRSPSELARTGLREYARHPLLTTVGVDRSYYAPVALSEWRDYAAQLPDAFRCCIKAPSAVTSYTIGPPGARDQLNPEFLSIDRLVEDLLEPIDAVFRRHAGPIILEFPPFGRGARLEPEAFLDRLEFFLMHIPRGFDLAVELRERSLLTPRYRQVLARYGVAHTYNFWSAMPMPAAQADVVAPEESPFNVVRLLLKPGSRYEDQRAAFRPFDRLQAPDEAMRRDVEAVTHRALKRQKRVYILVNNKAEGSSPLTIVELARRFTRTGAR